MREQALGEFLVTHGLLSADGLRRGLEAQRSLECRLGSVLLDLGLMSEGSLLKALGKYCSARTASATELTAVAPEVVHIVPARFALRHQVVPFRLVGKTLSVATIDPRDLLLEDELGLLTGCRIASFVALEVRIEQALCRYYGKQLSVQVGSLLKRLPSEGGVAEVQMAVGGGGAAAGAEVALPADVVAIRGSARAAAGAPRRSGLAPQRDPDESGAVVLSDDELADFPSLRKALEDSGTGRAEAAVAEAAPRPPAAAGKGGPAEPTSPPLVAADPGRKPADTGPVDDVEARLDAAAQVMQTAEMREDIADAILRFCAPYLRRRLLLAVREGNVMGWRGEGDGIDPLWVRSMLIPLDEPSVFVDLLSGKEWWLGPLQPASGNQELLLGLGGEQPEQCLVLPLIAGTRPIGFLYGDNLDQGFEEVPLEHLQRLAVKAGLAFQVYMLRSKIRTV